MYKYNIIFRSKYSWKLENIYEYDKQKYNLIVYFLNL